MPHKKSLGLIALGVAAVVALLVTTRDGEQKTSSTATTSPSLRVKLNDLPDNADKPDESGTSNTSRSRSSQILKLEGVVTDGNQIPIANTLIRALRSSQDLLKETRSNSQGVFRTELESGPKTLTLAISHEDYEDATQLLAIPPEIDSLNIELRLNPRIRVSGIVTDIAGNRVPHAVVRTAEFSWSTNSKRVRNIDSFAKADANGSFELRPSNFDKSFYLALYAEVSPGSCASAVVLHPHSTVPEDGARVDCSNSFSCTGKILDRQGVPISGTKITAYWNSDRPLTSMQADGEGRFALVLPTLFPVTVRIESEGFARYEKKLWPSLKPVEITVTLERKTSYQLEVVDAVSSHPIPEFHVDGSYQWSLGEESSSTSLEGDGSNGYWSFEAKPGVLKAQVRAPGYITSRFELNGQELQEIRKKLSLSPDSAGNRVTGKFVSSPLSFPCPSFGAIYSCALGPCESMNSFSIAEGGSFQITGLDEGDYKFVLSNSRGATFLIQDIHVPATRRSDLGDIALPETINAICLLSFPAGTAQQERAVEITKSEPFEDEAPWTTTADRNGTVRLREMSAGEYRLRAFDSLAGESSSFEDVSFYLQPGVTNVEVSLQKLREIRGIIEGIENPSQSSLSVVAHQKREPSKNIEIRESGEFTVPLWGSDGFSLFLRRNASEELLFLGDYDAVDPSSVLRVELPTASIEGHVLGNDGKPIGGAYVRLESGRRFFRVTSTSKEGSYRFLELPKGEYRLSVLADAKDNALRTISLAAQQRETGVRLLIDF